MPNKFDQSTFEDQQREKIPMTTPTRPPMNRPPVPPVPTTTPRQIQFGKIATGVGQRIVLYGPGGIGKTTLAASAPGEVAFFDLDESLSRLKLDTVPHVVPCESWADLRAALQMEWPASVKTIVIDSVTKAEELCVAHTLATVKHEKGHAVQRVEEYGFGKGYQFVFDTFLPILGDLDRHCRAGRNVILIAHDCTTNVPNPAGEDWLRYEPRLQSPNSGKASIRLRVKEWSDHMLFFGYDINVNESGKGTGKGTRTLWPCELPHCMAKSRTTQTPIFVDDPASVWAEILK
jgi:hypothetical protein